MADYVQLSVEAWEAVLAEIKRAPKVDNRLADALVKPAAFRWVPATEAWTKAEGERT